MKCSRVKSRILRVVIRIILLFIILNLIKNIYNQIYLRISDNEISCGEEQFVYKVYKKQFTLSEDQIVCKVFIDKGFVYTEIGVFGCDSDLIEYEPYIDYICNNEKYKIFRINNEYFIVDSKSKETIMLSDYIVVNANYDKLKQFKSILEKFYEYLQNHKYDKYYNRIYNDNYIEICEEVLKK